MTGNEKFQRHYLKLIHEHGYAENARQSKPMGPAWRTHIDDELMALSFPALLQYETDPQLKKIYRESLDLLVRSDERRPRPLSLFYVQRLDRRAEGHGRIAVFLEGRLA